jgi:hypothetical protein
MSRAPRRQFLAPFLLTVAAAIPGCKKGGPTETIRHDNPPADPYRSWTVISGSGSCEATLDGEACPPDAECDPPAPVEIECPDGVGADQGTIVQASADGPCTIADAEVACPEPLETLEEDPPEDELVED